MMKTIKTSLEKPLKQILINKNDLFSRRMGHEPKQVMQVNHLDQPARMAFYNMVDRLRHSKDYISRELFIDIARNYLSLSHDEIYEMSASHIINYITHTRLKNLFIKGGWYRIFDLIEYIEGNISIDKKEIIQNEIDEILTLNNIDYRFINGGFIPLTNSQQLEELSQAMVTPYQNTNEHIKKATPFL